MVNDILNDKERVEKFCKEFNYIEEFEDYITFLDDFLCLYKDIDDTIKAIQLCDEYILKLSNRLSDNIREERVILNIQRILLREKYRLFIMRDIVKLDEEVINSVDSIKNKYYYDKLSEHLKIVIYQYISDFKERFSDRELNREGISRRKRILENYIAGYEDIITYCDKSYLISLVKCMSEFTTNIRFYKYTLQELFLGNQVGFRIRFGDNFSDAYSDMEVI